MKRFKIFSIMAGLLLAMLATSCEGEKDLIIIDGNLPIKTSTLYMVGDATPNGWSIDAPTPLTASEEDPLIFSWEGTLYTGEVKLCLTPGSWDAPFIRPMEHGTEISSKDINDATFDMHAGDPDNKWRVSEAGKYRLTFDLRNWTMSTLYLGSLDGPTIEPIEAEAMYIVGDATPAGWKIDAPTALVKTADYTFVYEGKLKTGEMKGYTEVGNWGAPSIRPASANVKINKAGVESEDFVYVANPDDKWVVEEEGLYRLTFDLQNWKVKAEYLGEAPAEDPLLSANEVYMIGDATPGGWGWDNCIVMENAGNHVFTWTGLLAEGYIKGSVEKDYGAPFIRPNSDGVVINENGVAESGFVFTKDPDDKWHVTVSGYYTITFDLAKQTIEVKYQGSQSVDPMMLITELYLVGEATPNGWDIGNPTLLAKTGDHTFVYDGFLKPGQMKACAKKSTWDQPFVRPTSEDVAINSAGVAANDLIFTHENETPDYKWKVEEAGDYLVVFDLEHHTISVTSK